MGFFLSTHNAKRRRRCFGERRLPGGKFFLLLSFSVLEVKGFSAPSKLAKREESPFSVESSAFPFRPEIDLRLPQKDWQERKK
ncbi:hypothetical protein CH376_22615 [Leptospira adleri]|uniref:Uncharacterized protein n=1 Tax=Leptospira adleri TaxID=2023186 RepID=A0ABX4NS48_9LEPT|nr:hypothetical protein CH376_22615 [Leptospira adleri]